MMFTIPDPWREELKLLAGIALMATLAGMLTGQLFPCLLAGILLYTGWHLYQLARLARFLDENPHEEPDPVGAWKDIILRIREQKDNGNIRISELSYQLDRFRNMAKALPDAVVILDQSGRVDWSNPAAADILGILSPESRERLLTALVPDPVLKEYLSNRDFSNSLIIASPTSHEKVLSLLITPLQHEPSPIIIIARDITRQYYLDVTRRDFVANISHELRTPLTVITGLAEQLNTDKPDLTVLPRSTAL
ncbi:MAG: phosphate regulon sensor protein PhoR, partial [Gammaproteobacteria bacterium]|nr:phosphate regulon sensor protein PhoR [Gammaproteobacteria bacterium]